MTPETEIQQKINHFRSIGDSKLFMAREFLTWLWYQSEVEKEPYEFKHDQTTFQFQLWVDDRMLFSSLGDDMQENLLKGGDPSSSKEAAVAIRSGKTITELKLGMHIQGIGDFTCILKSSDLFPRSVQLPNEHEETEDEENSHALSLYQRLQYVNLFLAALDSIYDQFRALRLNDNWEEDTGILLSNWIKERENKKRTVH